MKKYPNHPPPDSRYSLETLFLSYPFRERTIRNGAFPEAWMLMGDADDIIQGEGVNLLVAVNGKEQPLPERSSTNRGCCLPMSQRVISTGKTLK